MFIIGQFECLMNFDELFINCRHLWVLDDISNWKILFSG